jgi:hypothetical protein
VSAHGLAWGGIGVLTERRWVSVVWYPRSLPHLTQPNPGSPATRAEARALSRLSELLADPGSALPRSAWKDKKLSAYVPSRYAICYSRGPSARPLSLAPSRVLGSLPAEARALLRGKTRTYPRSVPLVDAPFTASCSEVTTDEARSLGNILRAAGFERKKILFVWTNARNMSDRSKTLEISFEPILPHGRWVGAMGG